MFSVCDDAVARRTQFTALILVVSLLLSCHSVSIEVTKQGRLFRREEPLRESQFRYEEEVAHDFSASRRSSPDYMWAMRLALHIAQNPTRTTESASMLDASRESVSQGPRNFSRNIPRILHTVVKDCSNERSKHKLLVDRYELLPLAADFRLRCYDDASMPGYVRTWLPQYADIFGRLPSNIARSDLFRYMAVWHEGGFYADDDVVILPGFLRGIARAAENATSLAVGWERRTPTVSIAHQGCKNSVNELCSIGECGCMLCNSLAQWTFGAKQQHPVLLELVQQVVDFFDHPLWKHTETLADADILEHTGPVMFSTRILMHQSDILDMDAFGCGQHYANSPKCDKANESQWSQHLFEGKWRTIDDKTGKPSWACSL